MRLFLFAMVAIADAFCGGTTSLLRARRPVRAVDNDDIDAAFRELSQQQQQQQERDLVPDLGELDFRKMDIGKLLVVGSTSVGGAVVGISAAFGALFLGLFLLGSNSPLNQASEIVLDETSCILESNCDPS